MSTKRVAVCDQCGDEGPLSGPDALDIPAGWIITAVAAGDYMKPQDRRDFCSWRCAAEYAEREAMRQPLFPVEVPA